ncbi:uncharacterized protein LOC121854314 isoform X2 [Homarus americanus]|uniref:uncharacterized protein LOC121854314 isoform X2 n=1 Tax=Homarus americanus TaxID=6706 RepID=UPI001C4645F0|nr:uncharacterized protein LOC121854314 isoform X2 [Homarus americanus]
MGSRREHSGSVAGPQRHAHAKMDHERRNHELLKRLASDTSTAKTAKSVLGVSMSKSLTAELEKGLQEESPGQDPRGRTRGRKKSDIDGALKSFQRQTSSSALKMNHVVGDNMLEASPVKGKRDRSPVKNTRRRDSSPTKTLNTGNKNDKRGSLQASENTRRPHVFERLSKVDSNKSVGRADHPVSNKTSDRSTMKSGRRSPQEKNNSGDKHQSGRKMGVSDASVKPTHRRKRDISPVKNGEVIRRDTPTRPSIISGGGHRQESNEDDKDDKDSSTEKQEQENIPETVDKDRDDPVCRGGGDLSPMTPSTESPPGPATPTLTPCQERVGRMTGSPGPPVQERYKQAGTLTPESHPPYCKMDGRTTGQNTSPQAATYTPTRRASQQLTTGSAGNQKGDKICETRNSSTSRAGKCKEDRKMIQKSPNKAPTKIEPIKKTVKQEVRKSGSPQGSLQPPSTMADTPKIRNETRLVTVPSTSEVIQKVRDRVNEGRPQEKATVDDDDKDVCEADKLEDEGEFYKISVQTRLVTYNNSTLVIKNTSKSEGVGENAGNSDTETDSSGSLPDLTTTLQTSSAEAAAVGVTEADVEDDIPHTHALPHPTEAHQEGGGAGEFTRTRSVRKKLAQFVNKGRSFLSDVYSATQNKLEQYTRADSPSGSSWSSEATGDHHLARDDADSGYYSIPPSLVEVNPIWVEDHVQRAASWLRDHGYYSGPVTTLAPPDASVLYNGQERTFMAHSRKKVGGADYITRDSDVGGKEEEEEDNQEEEGDVGQSKDTESANVVVDEEWIKKNILCTCKCRHRTATSDKQETSDLNNTIETQVPSLTEPHPVCVAPDPQTNAEKVSWGEKDSPLRESTSRESDLAQGESRWQESGLEEKVEEEEEEEDMCYCSCHDEEGRAPPHLPQEVQELLDADHARMWWTITGNFGNILPIDWSKTYTRQQYLPVLNLNEIKDVPGEMADETDGGTDENAEEEEEVAQDLDLHHLILNGLTADPVKSAEEVIQEIDDIMQEGSSSEDEGGEETSSSGENSQESTSRPFPAPLFAEKLKNMSVAELNESLMELELVIRQYSETLINQLALRDELEYEKELKNSFISLLLQVQNKRRNFNVEKKKQKKVGPNGTDPKYLTTVIPYDVGHGPPHNPTLQILIKILMAINEDSPTVPTLLTDYILKVDS